MRKDKVYSLECLAEFTNLAAIRDFFVKWAKKAGLDAKQINDGKLAVDEAVTNVMRHAYGGMDKGKVVIECSRNEIAFNCTFKDWGKEFDWSSVIDPDLNKYVQIRRKGGLGVWLIKKLTDKVTHHRSDGVNTLSMFFNLPVSEAKPTAWEYLTQVGKRMTITVKFAVMGGGLITVLLAGIYLSVRSSQEGMATRAFTAKGVNAARNIADNAGPYVVEGNDIVLTELVARVKENVDAVAGVTVIDENGIVMADVDTGRLYARYRRPAGLTPLGARDFAQQTYRGENGRELLDVAVAIRLEKRKVGEVHVALDLGQIARIEGLSDSQLRTFFVTALVWALAMVLVVFLASVFVHPIRRLSRAMALIGQGSRDQAEIGGLGEFSDIGKAFDEMVSKLQQSEAQLTDQTRIKKEMQLAKDIQETLLPKEIPQTEGFQLAGNYRSALEMGGDYYDFFFVDKDMLGLVVGDVSGKGIGAAMIMTMVRTAMRTEARGNRIASNVLDKINRLVANDIKKGMYITMFYLVLDSKKRTINYSSAGHNPMILYRSAEDNTYFLNPKGFAVGLQLPDMNQFTRSIKSENVSLAKGDLLFIFTDGITEAMNADRAQFGEQRLVTFIKANHHLGVTEFSIAMDEEISRFTGDYPQSDDITYIVLKRKEDEEVEEYARVKRLIELVTGSNMLLEKVLERTGFTREEYDFIMEQYKAEGLESFAPAGGREDEVAKYGMSHATLEQSRKIVQIVREHPDWGAKRIQSELDTDRFQHDKLTVNIINKELAKLKLDTKARRKHFASRKLSENTIYSDLE